MNKALRGIGSTRAVAEVVAEVAAVTQVANAFAGHLDPNTGNALDIGLLAEMVALDVVVVDFGERIRMVVLVGKQASKGLVEETNRLLV